MSAPSPDLPKAATHSIESSSRETFSIADLSSSDEPSDRELAKWIRDDQTDREQHTFQDRLEDANSPFWNGLHPPLTTLAKEQHDPLATGEHEDGQSIDHFWGGGGKTQQASGGEDGIGQGEVDVWEKGHDTTPITPNRRGKANTTSPDRTPKAPVPKAPSRSASPWSSPASSKSNLHNDLTTHSEHEDTLEVREAALQARKAELHQAQAKLGRRETQLHDDHVELDRRERALQHEARRLHAGARRAEELEQLQIVKREQRETLLQTIQDKRAYLETRKTSYQNELMFIASQTKALEVQIRDLEQSMDVLKIERNNAMTRYRDFEDAAKAGIDDLVREVVKLLD